MFGYDGSQLPCHFFRSPIETSAERQASILRLQQEFQTDTDDSDFNYFTGLGAPHTVSVPQTRSTKRKGGLDWYIYREQVLPPKIFPFLFQEMTARQEILYFIANGAPSLTKDYNVAESLDCGFERIILPPCSRHLNAIEEV